MNQGILWDIGVFSVTFTLTSCTYHISVCVFARAERWSVRAENADGYRGRGPMDPPGGFRELGWTSSNVSHLRILPSARSMGKRRGQYFFGIDDYVYRHGKISVQENGSVNRVSSGLPLNVNSASDRMSRCCSFPRSHPFVHLPGCHQIGISTSLSFTSK